MRGFYRDEAKPTGWNNHIFPNVAMPHALWELQATQTPAQYDQTVADLVNYMQWMAEPAQTTRKNIGMWVLLFLAGLIFVTWRLNAAFWKDVK
jgi:ubiquinol-cytochrome c reductase cytochrome c1 subunit